MRVCETQCIGVLMILVVSSVIYVGSLLKDRCPLPETSLSLGNQEPGMRAAEVTGTQSTDGVYFLPEAMTVETLMNVIGLEGKVKPADKSLSDSAGYTIYTEAGVLKISNMPAVRRLTLGIPIDLNHASPEELSQVPGIGERLATRIFEIRQKRGNFTSVSDLSTVPGIKEKKLNSLKKYLIVNPTP